MTKKVWFVTGISSGLGKALAEAVIAQGDMLIGTFRTEAQAQAFNETHKSRALSLVLDVTHAAEVSGAAGLVMEQFGRIDVLVNNAGFGMAGAVEETSMEEVRDVFEANFFGALQVTQSFLPLFRKQRKGHIIQVSSHSGFKAFPGFGIYSASKFALEGFSEALAMELAPLGIKLTIVEPGPFRTGFAGHAFRQAEKVIDDYAETAGVFRQRIKQVDGKQEGDPVKAARAITDLVLQEDPPLRLPLGKVAVASLTAKLESVQYDLNTHREVAESVVFT